MKIFLRQSFLALCLFGHGSSVRAMAPELGSWMQVLWASNAGLAKIKHMLAAEACIDDLGACDIVDLLMDQAVSMLLCSPDERDVQTLNVINSIAYHSWKYLTSMDTRVLRTYRGYRVVEDFRQRLARQFELILQYLSSDDTTYGKFMPMPEEGQALIIEGIPLLTIDHSPPSIALRNPVRDPEKLHPGWWDWQLIGRAAEPDGEVNQSESASSESSWVDGDSSSNSSEDARMLGDVVVNPEE